MSSLSQVLSSADISLIKILLSKQTRSNKVVGQTEILPNTDVFLISFILLREMIGDWTGGSAFT